MKTTPMQMTDAELDAALDYDPVACGYYHRGYYDGVKAAKQSGYWRGVAFGFVGAVALAVALVALTGCSGGEKPTVTVAAGQNVQVPAFEWRVRDRLTLEQQWDASSGLKRRFDTDRVEGFAAVDPATGRLLVYTLPPQRVDDEVTLTLGHEVMHLALGDYHSQKAVAK